MRTILKFLALGGGGRSWYVRPSGGTYGSEDGTSYANAWDGFSNIVWASIMPGDTLYVCGTHTQLLTVGASGNAALYIKIKSFTADAGIVSGSLSRTQCVNANGRTYIEFDGLELLNSTDANLYLQDGTFIVRNVITHGATGTGAQGFQNETGTIATYYNCESYSNTDDGLSLHVNAIVTAYDCIFRNNSQGVNGIATSQFTAYRCNFYSNSTADLQPDSDANFTATNCFFQSTTGPNANSTVQLKVYNSILNNCNAVSAVLGDLLLQECTLLGTSGITSNKLATANRCYIKSSKNNQLITSGAGAMTMNYCAINAQAAVNVMAHGSTGTFVVNNCTAKCINNTSGVCINATADGFTANNLIVTVFQNAVTVSSGKTVTWNNVDIFNVTLKKFGAGTLTETGTITGDPKLNNPGSDDFSLQAGSAAIDAGINTGIATGISSASWGDTTPTYPVVTTATQGATYDLGAYIYN